MSLEICHALVIYVCLPLTCISVGIALWWLFRGAFGPSQERKHFNEWYPPHLTPSEQDSQALERDWREVLKDLRAPSEEVLAASLEREIHERREAFYRAVDRERSARKRSWIDRLLRRADGSPKG